jgi:hypothetical protein
MRRRYSYCNLPALAIVSMMHALLSNQPEAKLRIRNFHKAFIMLMGCYLITSQAHAHMISYCTSTSEGNSHLRGISGETSTFTGSAFPCNTQYSECVSCGMQNNYISPATSGPLYEESPPSGFMFLELKNDPDQSVYTASDTVQPGVMFLIGLLMMVLAKVSRNFKLMIPHSRPRGISFKHQTIPPVE